MSPPVAYQAHASSTGADAQSDNNVLACADENQIAALHLTELALRALANLLVDDAQCAEIKRLAPSVVQAVVDCQLSPSVAIVQASTDVLRKLQDHDSESFERAITYEVAVGRAVGDRVRTARDNAEGFGDDDDEADDFGGSWNRGIALPPKLGSATASAFTTATSYYSEAEADTAGAPTQSQLQHNTDQNSTARRSATGSARDLVRHMLGN